MINGLAFRHPVAFWFGCALLVGGVFAHGPMFMMGQHTHWQMVGMPMTTEMWLGMAAIPVGLALSAYGMMPRLPGHAGSAHAAPLHFHVANGVPLNRAHATLVLVLVVALAVDVMKPATRGFLMPGMGAEYAIGKSTSSLLALFALTGTTAGSVVWGRIADRAGRRVFGPAGMRDSGSLPEDVAVPGRAVAYMRKDGAWHDAADTLPYRGTAAGGGYSTAGDLLKFARASLAGKLLSPQLLAEATRNQTPWYGYGFMAREQEGVRMFGHAGGASGMNGDLRIYPDLGVVVVGLANVDPPAADRLVGYYYLLRMPSPAKPGT